jgi:hypothetical protein
MPRVDDSGLDADARDRALLGELSHTRSFEDASLIEAHVHGCEPCQRELGLLRAVRARLRHLPETAPESALEVRVFAALGDRARGERPAVVRSRPPRRWVLATAAGWAAAAVFAALFARRDDPGDSEDSEERLPPMVNEALREYERASANELPKPSAAAELELRFGRRIPYLLNADLEVVSAWVTTIREEPSAAIAYRFGDHVLIQFVVSEALFFRQPVVRDAIARSGAYVARAGARAVIGRARSGTGSLLVGEISPSELERLFQRSS